MPAALLRDSPHQDKLKDSPKDLLTGRPKTHEDCGLSPMPSDTDTDPPVSLGNMFHPMTTSHITIGRVDQRRLDQEGLTKGFDQEGLNRRFGDVGFTKSAQFISILGSWILQLKNISVLRKLVR